MHGREREELNTRLFLIGSCLLKSALFACSSHLLHASDADQAQELLMRWSAEGAGKVPGKLLSLGLTFLSEV
jgi:hypothetical protein